MNPKTVIWFTGAQSSGKSTCIKAVSDNLPIKHSIIPGDTRLLSSLGLLSSVDVKANSRDQMIINAAILMHYYRIYDSESCVFLSERTPIDVYAYALNTPNMLPYVLSFNENFLVSTLNRKDIKIITFYFPPIIPFIPDGVRSIESRDIIDKTIVEIMEKYNIPYNILHQIDIEFRINFILDKILSAL